MALDFGGWEQARARPACFDDPLIKERERPMRRQEQTGPRRQIYQLGLQTNVGCPPPALWCHHPRQQRLVQRETTLPATSGNDRYRCPTIL